MSNFHHVGRFLNCCAPWKRQEPCHFDEPVSVISTNAVRRNLLAASIKISQSLRSFEMNQSLVILTNPSLSFRPIRFCHFDERSEEKSSRSKPEGFLFAVLPRKCSGSSEPFSSADGVL